MDQQCFRGELFDHHLARESVTMTLFLQCLLLLEKELVTLGAMCAASLLREDTVLPFAGMNIVGRPKSLSVASMRLVPIPLVLWF